VTGPDRLATASFSARVEAASALLGKEPARAERDARAMLALAPNDPRLRLILASARRRRGDAAAALAILAPLAKAFPKAAHTRYELGLALSALRQEAPAVAALREAVALNPRLAEAWRALGDRLFAAGDASGAEAAFAAHDRAMITDPALAPAADALYSNRLDKAERLLREHLTRRPDDAAGLRLMAEVLLRRDRPADAELVIDRALRLDPDHVGARFVRANALFQQQKAPEALAEAEGLLAHSPDDVAYRNLLAGCLALIGDFDRVIATYESLLTTYERQPRLWLNHGHALRTVGRRADAVAAYRRAIALAPNLGDAYWSLANLKVSPLSAGDEAVMSAQLARPEVDPGDRLHLHYALGKALEDRGEHQGAFDHYARGAAIRRATNGYDPDEEAALVARSTALFTASFLAERADWGAPALDPIFIVGLPRSGSTLIEQILASHSAVEGTMELPEVGFIANRLRRTSLGYPGALANLDPSAILEFGEGYLNDTRVQRRLGRPFFIDKMPNNFRHVGLIRLVLPKARIIDARRHPLATCFSAFKQHFAQGQGFSYDLGELGRYYRDYVALMAHFDAVAPGAVHRVIHEDLVEDTEGQVRRLLAYLDLPFEEACLRFHENDRAVRTVSSEQVRRPIFRDGLEQWRRYEPFLGPLKEALGPALWTWR
jgi:tetratricopeptide (TPR) repeat protein